MITAVGHAVRVWIRQYSKPIAIFLTLTLAVWIVPYAVYRIAKCVYEEIESNLW